LKKRFAGVVPEEMQTILQAQDDPKQLAYWLDMAASAASLEEFRSAL
jgi:hypothetical protein